MLWLIHVIFPNFSTELWPLIDFRIMFMLNILCNNWWIWSNLIDTLIFFFCQNMCNNKNKHSGGVSCSACNAFIESGHLIDFLTSVFYVISAEHFNVSFVIRSWTKHFMTAKCTYFSYFVQNYFIDDVSSTGTFCRIQNFVKIHLKTDCALSFMQAIYFQYLQNVSS